MLIRMCPLCDHEMKKRHHCDTCGSFIWKPEMVDVHLNEETRGLGEENCAYPTGGGHMHQGTGNRQNLSQKGKTSNVSFAAYRPQTAYTHQGNSFKNARSNDNWRKNTFHTGQRDNSKNKKVLTWSLIIVIVVSVISVLAPIAESLDLVDKVVDFFEDGDFELFKDEYEDNPQERSLTHEEVMAEGLPCNGYTHLLVDGCLVFQQMFDFSLSRDYILTEGHEISERNTVYPWDDMETSYFEIQENYWDDDYKINITARYDSYNNELHSLFMIFDGRETAAEHMKYALQILDDAGIDVGNWKDRDIENALTFNGGEDYQFIDNGVLEIYTSVSEYDDGNHYVVEISAQ